MKTAPTSLADLDSNAVSVLGVLTPEQLAQWAEASGHRYLEADLANLRTRKAALRAIGKAFGFPRWYGANLDALYDCLTDLPEAQSVAGYVVVLRGFGDTALREGLSAEDRAEILDVFRDAAAQFTGGDITLRVFYT